MDADAEIIHPVMSPDLLIGDRAEIQSALVSDFKNAADEAIAARGAFLVVLAGGSIAATFFPSLAQLPLDWSRVDFFWADERAVPPEHPDSNYGDAMRLWLTPAGVPADRIHRMALSCQPELLIADEPTTALDVTIQAQILDLIQKLKQETGTSVILITHDLGVVAGTTNRVIVMYAGRIFESAPTAELFARPGNPYTKGLLLSVPDPTVEEHKELYQIPGLPPDMAKPATGCPFADRCYRVESICREQAPPFVQLSPDHHSL